MNKSLEELRKEIDAIDDKLLSLLHERSQIAASVGQLKQEHGIKPLDANRWQQLLEKKLSQAEALHLSKEFVKNFFTVIHEHSLELQGKKD